MRHGQTFKHSGSVERWAGTPSKMLDVASLAALLLSQVAGRDMTGEAKVHLDSSTYEEIFEGLAAFRQGLSANGDLDRVNRLTFDVGSTHGGGPHITLTFQRVVPAATYEIVGWDRTWVEGVATQLEEALRENEQRLKFTRWASGDRPLRVSTVSATLLLAVALLAVTTGHTLRWILASIGFIWGGLLLLYLLSSLIVRRYQLPLELFETGGQTRWEHERRRVLALIGALGLILASAIATALATRFIG